MPKRKRALNGSNPNTDGSSNNKKSKADDRSKSASTSSTVTVQVVAGSYDQVLHGITITLKPGKEAEFADTFLFNAHTSAIKSVALSPPSAPIPKQTQKIVLASGGTDERINLYHLSAHPPRKVSVPIIPSLTSRAVVENPQNKELGSLVHHASSITSLQFPTRSKLLSSSEDSTIAITRTRDWSLLSTIKAPIPKAHGRPSGDTAPPGGTPSGINDFAVHPSLKLMISVGKGERSMRLWNLVTGKKAGVLNFTPEVLRQIGEGRFHGGEGRKVAWGSTAAGDEFCVGFDRGIIVFGMDSKPKCVAGTKPLQKLHQIRYITISEDEDEDESLLAASTEDGRVVFFSTAKEDLVQAADSKDPLPSARLTAQIGGKEAKVTGRIKDFVVLKLDDQPGELLVVTASSDGAIRVWRLSTHDIRPTKGKEARQAGKLVGTYQTENRITCLAGFVMLPLPAGVEEDLEEDVLDEDLDDEENEEDEEDEDDDEDED